MDTWEIKIEIGAKAAEFIGELYKQGIGFTVKTVGVNLIIKLVSY